MWFVWSGIYWLIDEVGKVFNVARLFCRKSRGKKKQMSSSSSVLGVLRMARRTPEFVVKSDFWNKDAFLLGTPGGTVDLRTGELRQPKQEDYINKLTSVTPAPKGALCPTWQKFLDEVTGGDKAVQRFLQQYAGYCLTGDTREEALIFIWGPGRNGKSVFQSVLIEILGDYAVTAAMETFAASKYPRHLTELAMLHGARLVTASETDKDQAWSESRIKLATGGDSITANFMRQDHFTFIPRFKLLLIGNHKPKLMSVDEAIQRRFNIVEFTFIPAKPDKDLRAKLRKEYPAILRWMINGCLDWQANGLIRPPSVLAATSEYFEEQDMLKHWIEEECVCGPTKKATASELYACWKQYAIENNEDPGSFTAFGSALKQRGFEKIKTNGFIVYLRIELKFKGNEPKFTSDIDDLKAQI